MPQPGEKVALVTGAMGVQGRGLLKRLEKDDTFAQVYAVGRRHHDLGNEERLQQLRINLKKKEEVTHELNASHVKPTHIFHTAFVDTGDDEEDVVANLRMLRNIVEGAEAAGSKLEHVALSTGTKWYGAFVRQYVKTPMVETDSRLMPPNFYYNQEDYLAERVEKGAGWSWSSLRPGPIVGFSHGSFMNILNVIAVYATICKELGITFQFPGSDTSYRSLIDLSDVDIIADAHVFLAMHKHAANTAYNISTGDVIRWEQVWSKIAAVFQLEVGLPLQTPLAKVMTTPDKEELWERLKKKHQLQDIPYNQLATWPFGDMTFNAKGDLFADVNKLRRAGFDKMNGDTPGMLIRHLKQLADDKIIPPLPNVDKMRQPEA